MKYKKIGIIITIIGIMFQFYADADASDLSEIKYKLNDIYNIVYNNAYNVYYYGIE